MELRRRLDTRQFLRQLPGAGGELVDEIDLLDQAADAFRQRIEGGARRVLVGVALRQCLGRLRPEVLQVLQQRESVGVVGVGGRLQFRQRLDQRFFRLPLDLVQIGDAVGEGLELRPRLRERRFEGVEVNRNGATSSQTAAK